jgi:hypothetical protein
MYTSAGGSIAQSLYGYNSVLGLDEDYLKNDIVNGFFNSMEGGVSGAFLLLATDDYALDIKGDRAKKEQKLAYVYIPLEVKFMEGQSIKVSSGVIKENIIESSGIERNEQSGYYNGNGSITFKYEIPNSLELKSFEFNMYTSTNDMFYEVYNVKAGVWEKLDNSNLIAKDEKVSNYYDGSILVRITATDYVDFESPDFKFEGVGK